MWVTSSLTTALTPTAVALGNFDGLHRGHRQVIQPILQATQPPHPLAVATNTADLLLHDKKVQGFSALSGLAESVAEARLDADQGFQLLTNGTIPEVTSLLDVAADLRPTGDLRPYTTVVTFYPHPKEFFSGQMRSLLTPLDEKIVQLQALGVEQLVLLPFNQALANLSPQDFVEEILVRQLQAKSISVGQDFHFGYRRLGRVDDLQAIATAHGVDVNVVSLQLSSGERISSSAIRQALQDGDVQTANHLLGRSYSLVGRVVHGQQLGRTIGFPTANLKLASDKFLPCQGVYAVRVSILNSECRAERLPGVMNIGYRPTVNGTVQTVEVHVLNWSGDLYGCTLTVHLADFIRPEQKFTSLEALKNQIQADCEQARERLSQA